MAVTLTPLPWPFDENCVLVQDLGNGMRTERQGSCDELRPIFEQLKRQEGPAQATGIALIDWFQGLIGGGGGSSSPASSPSSSSTSSAIPASVPRAPVSSLTSGTIAGIPTIAFIAAGIGAAAFFATRKKKRKK